ncbi:MAG: hypothetical protein NTW68_02900 [candidate division NC10 bacterium]|nr:hypothetical protein [candidate division NC10 bacterium]
MDEARIKRALDMIDSMARGVTEGQKATGNQQQHRDSMVVWIVGLAAAAVVGLPPMYNYILDLKNAPGWVLGIPIGFFVLAVFFGIGVRLLLSKLMQAEMLHAQMKVIGWGALRFKYPENEEGLMGLLKDAHRILLDQEPELSAQKKMGERTACWIGRFEHLPFVFFALAVLFAAAFAICPPSKCIALPW